MQSLKFKLITILLLYPSFVFGRSLDEFKPILDKATAVGLPVEPLTNKIREGFVKNRSIEEIKRAVEQRFHRLQVSQELIEDGKVRGLKIEDEDDLRGALVEAMERNVSQEVLRVAVEDISQRGRDSVYLEEITEKLGDMVSAGLSPEEALAGAGIKPIVAAPEFIPGGEERETPVRVERIEKREEIKRERVKGVEEIRKEKAKEKPEKIEVLRQKAEEKAERLKEEAREEAERLKEEAKEKGEKELEKIEKIEEKPKEIEKERGQ